MSKKLICIISISLIIIAYLPSASAAAKRVKITDVTGADFLTFEVSGTVTVYVGRDSRGDEEKGGKAPEWLTKDFKRVEGWKIEVSDTNMGYFTVWKKDFSAGTIKLGGNADPPAAGQGSNYVVLIVPVSVGTAVKPLGKLPIAWSKLKANR